MENKLIILCGLQGSGKSTYARETYGKDKNTNILSSDEYRKQNPEFDNEKVFRQLYADMNSYLGQGFNVVLDATNLTIKGRKKIFMALKDKSIRVECVVVATPFEACKERVVERNKNNAAHYVPLEVLDKYLKSFQIPIKSEGFSSIEFIGFNKSKNYTLRFIQMSDFEQHNPHHSLTLDQHCIQVSKLLRNYGMGYSGLLHDYGKLFTQTFDEKGIAHYYGHENVGAYILISNGFSANTAEVVNYHMLPYCWESEKSRKKWLDILGDELFNKLIIFNMADRQSH